MSSRRKFISNSIGVVAGALAAPGSASTKTSGQRCPPEFTSLCGEWLFRTDKDDLGVNSKWFAADTVKEEWRPQRISFVMSRVKAV